MQIWAKEKLDSFAANGESNRYAQCAVCGCYTTPAAMQFETLKNPDPNHKCGQHFVVMPGQVADQVFEVQFTSDELPALWRGRLSSAFVPEVTQNDKLGPPPTLWFANKNGPQIWTFKPWEDDQQNVCGELHEYVPVETRDLTIVDVMEAIKACELAAIIIDADPSATNAPKGSHHLAHKLRNAARIIRMTPITNDDNY